MVIILIITGIIFKEKISSLQKKNFNIIIMVIQRNF